MAKIRTITGVHSISGKVSKQDNVYFKTNSLNGEVIAVKQLHFPLRDNEAQASEAQKAHQAAFKAQWKKVDALLAQPVRQLYEELYYRHLLACRQRRPLRQDNSAVEAFLASPEVIPTGVDKQPQAIIEDLKTVRKPFTTLRTFVFHCLR